MDFNQLLQRDLDDHRIAHELVPYILRDSSTGPAFFPPIVAALLPFEDRRPLSAFPHAQIERSGSDPEYAGTFWRFLTCGDAFRLQEHVDEHGDLARDGITVLRWNDERAKLVIIDGQHRAMALLAIHRTRARSWGAGASASERYRPFYETRVDELLRGLSAERLDRLDALEFPVTVCVFVDELSSDGNPHAAARKLFVDVNKEARPPSESRLILLSDIRLDHILARELLNKLRVEGVTNNFPLYVVEYDNPEPRMLTPRRWNAVTNLEILLRSVGYCCFGPEEIISEVGKLTSVKGKPNRIKMDAYFRKQMRFQEFLGDVIQDGPRGLERSGLGRDAFPVYNQEARREILDRFLVLWGKGILRLLSEIEPYKAHISAARAIHDTWGPTPDVTGALAREALFEGVGMFWTLERGHKYWRDQVAEARDKEAEPPMQTDVSRAWEIVDSTKRADFEHERARQYLGKSSTDAVEASREFYDVAITYAAQVGLVLTWATLRRANPSVDPDEILEAMIGCINSSLRAGGDRQYARRLIFRKGQSADSFNLLGKMDSRFASFFRGFWLELLLCDSNEETLKKVGVDVDGARELRDTARCAYLSRIAADNAQAVRRTDPTLASEKATQVGREKAIKALARAYKKWFGMEVGDAREMLSALLERATEEDEGGKLEQLEDSEESEGAEGLNNEEEQI